MEASINDITTKAMALVGKLSNIELEDLIYMREERHKWLANHPIGCLQCFGDFRCARYKALEEVILLYDETIEWKMEMLH